MTDEKLYSKNEMESIIAQRALESNRDERIHLIETGFATLNDKVDKANHLKAEIIEVNTSILVRLDKQDVEIAATWDAIAKIPAEIPGLMAEALKARWTKKWKWLVGGAVAALGVGSPFLVVLMQHFWPSHP